MQVTSLSYISRANKLEKLSSLTKLPWSILLDSAGSDINYNRYDIFVAEPSVKLSFKGKTLNLDALPHIHLPSRTNDSPLETMRNILASLRSSAPGSKPTQPFNGGWLGYISYDFGRYLEKLPDLTDDQIQLPWLKFGLYQWALITDH
ncbi:MAG: hypothetical protein OQJ89_05865, partial [Kangiellaceae bacterium]|nr:hypothetical protein [Kangiellaceae bacterium]